MRRKTAAALLLLAAQQIQPLWAAGDELPSLPLPNSLLPAGATPAPAAAPVVTASNALTTAVTFADMGAQHGLQLNHQQLQTGVAFTLPQNMVITSARLKLTVRASDMQLHDQNLQLMLNGQPLGAVPLDQATGSYVLDIPASMIASKNNLSFQLRSGDDLLNNDWTCQRNAADQGSITLQPSSALELNGLWLNTRKTLADFPRPFFDPLQMQENKLDVAFSAQPDAGVLTASAIVASAFGVINRDRASHFNATFDQLPTQNGILFGKPGDRIGAVTLPASEGPALQLIDNPLNPQYKLLIVSGRNGQELRQAAQRLSQGKLPDSDNIAVPVTTTVPPRQAYDAPRWIDTRQSISLSALSEDKEQLIARGFWHGENALTFRASPDLFMWDGKTIPLELSYRFAQKSWLDSSHSVLNVSLNGEFLKSLPASRNRVFDQLFSFFGLTDSGQQHAVINIDPQLVYGSNRLAFYYDLRAKSGVPCQTIANDNTSSHIGGDSTLNLSHAWHFGELPNTSWFTSALFPFTRYADLARTVVIMPSQPEASDIAVLLDLMARAGNTTGVSVNYLHLFTGFPSQPADNELLTRSDVIAIGALNRGSLMPQLLQQSPFIASGNSISVKDIAIAARLQGVLNGRWKMNFSDVDDFFANNTRWRGLVSFRSPWSEQHVVVLATASESAQLRQLPDDMSKPAVTSAGNGDLLLISDSGESRSWRAGKTFTSGDLPLWMQGLWLASEHWFALLLIACLLARSASLALFAWLKQHAADRLRGDSKA